MVCVEAQSIILFCFLHLFTNISMENAFHSGNKEEQLKVERKYTTFEIVDYLPNCLSALYRCYSNPSFESVLI